MEDLPKMLDKVFEKMTKELATKDSRIIELEEALKEVLSQLEDEGKHEILRQGIKKRLNL